MASLIRPDPENPKTLPDETWVQILMGLEPIDLYNLMLVNRKLANLVGGTTAIWIRHMEGVPPSKSKAIADSTELHGLTIDPDTAYMYNLIQEACVCSARKHLGKGSPREANDSMDVAAEIAKKRGLTLSDNDIYYSIQVACVVKAAKLSKRGFYDLGNQHMEIVSGIAKKFGSKLPEVDRRPWIEAEVLREAKEAEKKRMAEEKRQMAEQKLNDLLGNSPTTWDRVFGGAERGGIRERGSILSDDNYRLVQGAFVEAEVLREGKEQGLDGWFEDSPTPWDRVFGGR